MFLSDRLKYGGNGMRSGCEGHQLAVCVFNTKVHLAIWLTSVMQNEVNNCIFFRIPLGSNILFIRKKIESYQEEILDVKLSWGPDHKSAYDETSVLSTTSCAYWLSNESVGNTATSQSEAEQILEVAERMWADTALLLIRIFAQNLRIFVLVVSLVIWPPSNQSVRNNQSERGCFYQRPFRLGRNKIKWNSNTKKILFLQSKHKNL